MNHKATYVFKVHDEVPQKSKAFVFVEPSSVELTALEGLGFGFVLKSGSQEEAEEVADFLNQHVVGLTTW